jgi:hypothetical protein
LSVAYPLAAYSDEELGRMVRQALGGTKPGSQARAKARKVLVGVLDMMGYGWVDHLIDLVMLAWDAARSFWRRIFGRPASARP